MLTQAFDTNMRSMEAQMQAAQEAAVTRIVAQIESKAQGFVKAMRDLDTITAERDEENRSAGEQQVWGGVGRCGSV